jgi:DNA polymerase III subunit epsilon
MTVNHRPMVFLDVETTGTSSRTGRIIEIGALRIEKNQIVREFKQLVYPEMQVPWFITQLTAIRNEDLWGKPTFAGIADDLESMLDDAIFVAHNVGFDYSFIQSEFARLNRPFKADRFCTAKLSRMLYPQHRRHSLDAIIDRHQYRVENRHRAYDDAAVLYKFFHEQYEKLDIDLFRSVDKILIKTT